MTFIECPTCEGVGYAIVRALTSTGRGATKVTCDACNGEGTTPRPKKRKGPDMTDYPSHDIDGYPIEGTGGA